jgi:hypothetical protein
MRKNLFYLHWSPTVKEEHRSRVFENRVLRRIFGPTKEEVVGGWRRLCNDSSQNIISMIESRRMGWAGNAVGMRDEKCIQHFGLEI